MKAISIDEWELIMTHRLDKTMDTCIGIATYDSTKQYGTLFNYSHHRLLMVEFKLKCTSPKRVSMTDLLGKVRHTRSFFPNQAVDPANIFIFPVALVSYYKADLTRAKNGSGKTNFANWEIMSPEDFNTYVAFEEDLPFQPLDSKEEIVSNISSAYDKGKSKGLEKALDNWKCRMQQYLVSYRLKDADHVKHTVKEVMEKLLPNLSKDDKEFIEMEYFIFLD